jgi:ComF family protein
MKQLVQIPALLREYLFPAGCAVCGAMLLDTDEAWYGICRDCQARFTLEKEVRCSRCGRPLISEIDRCLHCRNGETHYFDQAVALFPYTGDYMKLLGAYKFGKYKAVGTFFLEKILEGIACFSAPLQHPVLVPVPPRPGKIKKTGWDQIDSLAKGLKRAYQQHKGSSYPLYTCLKRLPSRSQKELNQENRKTNLLGRIHCTRPVPPEVIIFDDVITTGSTLDACAAALKAGGAEKVYGVCLFYT